MSICRRMQRIPGVTISRGAPSLGGTATSTGTPPRSRCAASGLPSTKLCTMTARFPAPRAAPSTSVRSSADFVSQIDVLKSPDTTLSSGAIGATVNIKFPKPFDHPGLELVGSASGHVIAGTGQSHAQRRCADSATPSTTTRSASCSMPPIPINRTRGNHVNIQGWEGFNLNPASVPAPPRPARPR